MKKYVAIYKEQIYNTVRETDKYTHKYTHKHKHIYTHKEERAIYEEEL